MSETYVCPYCAAAIEREYRVQYLIRTCDECGDNGRFVHAEVAAALESVSAADLPEGWSDEPLDERLLAAVREGALDVEETKVHPEG
ncbi:hypothetical protein [Halobaculum litoreum]|uniref:Uncharacterized protein n=1 Tax=Halobaculum litoreum TaxID=3031998 RepID=A0ABD5XTJ8_9EURY|nr:hypothetical protein [Halobaculum sp. DT92]